MLQDNALAQLFNVLKNKSIVGIRKDSPSAISLKFNDGTIVSIEGGAVDYGEIDYLDIEIKPNSPSDNLIIGEF